MLLRLLAHRMCVFLLTLPASAVPVFHVQAVGPVGYSSSATAIISSTGAAAGTAMTPNGAFRAFSADANGAATLLAGLGGANSYANAINSAGTVAGHSQDVSAALRATIWQGTSPTSLGTLGGINSYAYGINDSGQVVGYSDLAGDAGTAAFLFASGSLYNVNSLLTPGSGWQIQNAYGINSAGQIVGTGIYNGEQLAVLLTPQPGYGTFAEADPGPAVPEPATIFLISSAALGYLALRLRIRP